MLQSFGDWKWPNSPDDVWAKMFAELTAFQAKYNHCDVVRKDKLGNWCDTQRRDYRELLANRQTPMSKYRITALESIGFTWSPSHAAWETKINMLKEYQREHGDCSVPTKYTPNPSLAGWVSMVRCQYKRMTEGKSSSLTPVKIAEAEALGFEWVMDRRNNSSLSQPDKESDEAWLSMFDRLKKYFEEVGDCDVPRESARFPELGQWCDNQRKRYHFNKAGKNSAKCNKKREEMLEGIGFHWTSKEKLWSEKVEMLKIYKQEHGDCLVPSRYPLNQALAGWVSYVRNNYKSRSFPNIEDDDGKDGKKRRAKMPLSKVKVEELESIGFCWDGRLRHNETARDEKLNREWKKNLALLKEYKVTNGDLYIPVKYPTNQALATWVASTRRAYRSFLDGKTAGKYTLTKDKIDELEQLGFLWRVKKVKKEIIEKRRGRKASHPIVESVCSSENNGIVKEESSPLKKTKLSASL